VASVSSLKLLLDSDQCWWFVRMHGMHSLTLTLTIMNAAVHFFSLGKWNQLSDVTIGALSTGTHMCPSREANNTTLSSTTVRTD
jgi:hypothetical protein